MALKATVRSDLLLFELPEHHELLQIMGNLGERVFPHRIWRQRTSAIVAEAEHARAHSIEAIDI